MNDTIAEVARFGAELDVAWARGGRSAAELPELARAALLEARLHDRIDPMEAVRWVLSGTELPPQYDPQATFGEPPVTVWRNEHLFIDMYFWVVPDIALHDHAFAGAFTNLAGHSLHCVYSFAGEERPANGVALGQLDLARVETLGPGSACAIHTGAAFIHRVWHLSRPTITLVARTPRVADTLQARYFLPSLALNDPLRDPSRVERFLRQQQFMRYVVEVSHPDADKLCRDLIVSVPPLEAFNHLEAYVYATQKNADDWERCDAIVADLVKRHGAWADAFGVALHKAAALRAVRWDRLLGFHERLLLALLQTYSSRAGVLEAAERFRRERPELLSGTASEWLQSAIASGGLTLQLSEEQVTVALLLADGATNEAVLDRFSEDYDLGDAERAALVELADRLRAQPVIGKLFT